MRRGRLPIKGAMINAHETEDNISRNCNFTDDFTPGLKSQSVQLLLPEQDGLLRMIMAKLNQYFKESATQTYLAIIRILVPPLQTIFFFFEHPVYLFRQLHQLFRVLLDFGLFAKLFPKFFGFA